MKMNNKILVAFSAVAVILGGAYVLRHIMFKPQPLIEDYQNNHKNMLISSSAFIASQAIPDVYGCKGQDINPPLEIAAVPSGTKSLALLVDDPDAYVGDWTHWLVWNIKPETLSIKENSVPEGAIQGLNDFGNSSYGGPCPSNGQHRYQFKAYALDTTLDLPLTAKKADFLKAISGHILDQALLVGTYKR